MLGKANKLAILTIAFSVIWFTASDYLFGIFKLFSILCVCFVVMDTKVDQTVTVNL
jgi:hypothetical protein